MLSVKQAGAIQPLSASGFSPVTLQRGERDADEEGRSG